ncbi:type I-E CRISPR-associated protein Cas7/Cse4/CasC [Stratiformator vulcanicus]|uniref:CRISPR system Cascade subunit CasC n=1 Tax=Stratiformator vulcanicus TaxID=2527980 RepID=A0A517R140_9PLAN|nr:type I-E CRISPR-associated protein Cas7/Cse4/CasC [Stratiformator vulcanicus]QDT37591.1 CRISPR system Cascade subunit CasC [Stratiformator vulcanicus]
MFLEVHILQNFAPSNLNRDDTGAPKDCVFGGYRRARISSQCIKRSIRRHFRDDQLLAPQVLAFRTKRVIGRVAEHLVRDHGRDEGLSLQKTANVLQSQKIKSSDDFETEYLLFLGEDVIQRLVKVVDEYWDQIPEDVSVAEEESGTKTKKAKKPKKGETTLPDEIKSAAEQVLGGEKVADVALFGRMLADLPGKNVDASCQVAHAISTNKVEMEMDFFTAVDDLKNREEDAGAGMLGTVEFNSACYYRYANVDLNQLVDNLQGDEELANKTVEAFLRASISAVPTGKQNSFAAQNPPTLILCVLRDQGLWSLANAFEKPIDPKQQSEHGLTELSADALLKHWDRLCGSYGDSGIKQRRLLSLNKLDDEALGNLKDTRVDTLEQLLEQTLKSVHFRSKEGASA